MDAHLPRTLRPFQIGQFRILAVGLALSLFGDGVWVVSMVWQTIELGGGPTDLSLVATASSIGLVGAVLLGGAIADRVPQKRILIAVEVTKAAGMAAGAALAMSGILEIWHLAALALLFGIADGFFYPAYSALLPTVLPAEHLLAANGIEGVLRPAVMQAPGPAAASVAITVASPGAAFALTSLSQLLAVGALALLAARSVTRETASAQHPLRSLFEDVREGFVYMIRTPWLLGTLLFALLMVLVVMGPIEVLLPFAVKDQTGGGAGAFALALAAFGIGGALGSITVASVRLPRRYLTVMNSLWGLSCIPLVIIGYTNQLWLMVLALFVVGFGFSASTVIWGTLLQRRVPSALLGRVSSLDFFVSLAFLPISMAVAGPIGEAVGVAPTFVVAGVVPSLLAIAAILVFRMRADEIQHPLDLQPPQENIARVVPEEGMPGESV